MTRDQFRAHLAELGLSLGDFAALAGVSYSQVRAWGETSPVPRPIRLILRLLDERGHVHELLRT
ncbi:helix-turn-helix transcriptional regulator [uncultured Thiodictyon sp.]|uniref:helix-turn-helix domain-containing protein n=1 Tax=uncultured Thiodictyon sp. TaxID=1846217 RepID=UPI0025D113FE|nr:helix-turn-helix transcriptional regulator [uncultured Thiodictyon sp.]